MSQAIFLFLTVSSSIRPRFGNEKSWFEGKQVRPQWDKCHHLLEEEEEEKEEEGEEEEEGK
ncbi:hypothetical protein HGM15179_018331, partial [Zosterops borbonicus]